MSLFSEKLIGLRATLEFALFYSIISALLIFASTYISDDEIALIIAPGICIFIFSILLGGQIKDYRYIIPATFAYVFLVWVSFNILIFLAASLHAYAEGQAINTEFIRMILLDSLIIYTIAWIGISLPTSALVLNITKKPRLNNQSG